MQPNATLHVAGRNSEGEGTEEVYEPFQQHPSGENRPAVSGARLEKEKEHERHAFKYRAPHPTCFTGEIAACACVARCLLQRTAS